jgi:hypothetical protein
MSENENTRSGGTEGDGIRGVDGEKERSPRQDQECGQGFDGWWEDRSLGEKIGLGMGFGILGIGLVFLFGLVVMALWNWLMPEIFGLKQLNYWQAWGLLLLSCILFGRLGSGGSSGSSDRKRKRKLRTYLREEEGPSKA